MEQDEQGILLDKLRELEGHRVTLIFKDGGELECDLNFVGPRINRQPEQWFVTIDNGAQSIDVSAIKSVEDAKA